MTFGLLLAAWRSAWQAGYAGEPLPREASEMRGRQPPHDKRLFAAWALGAWQRKEGIQ